MEVRKALLSGWDAIREADAVPACETFYNDQTIHMLQDAHINWIWVTWSSGFAQETEAQQRQILRPWIAKCHAAGIHVTAYLSLTNMFIDDMLAHVPASQGWMQLEADGTPRPYSAAKYKGKITRIIACLNNPGWLEYSRHPSRPPSRPAWTGFSMTIASMAANSPCVGGSLPSSRRAPGHPLSVPGVKDAAIQRNTQGAEIVVDRSSMKVAELAWREFCFQTVAAALAQHRRYAESLRRESWSTPIPIKCR